jgi:hypothetical protein
MSGASTRLVSGGSTVSAPSSSRSRAQPGRAGAELERRSVGQAGLVHSRKHPHWDGAQYEGVHRCTSESRFPRRPGWVERICLPEDQAIRLAGERRDPGPKLRCEGPSSDSISFIVLLLVLSSGECERGERLHRIRSEIHSTPLDSACQTARTPRTALRANKLVLSGRSPRLCQRGRRA